MEITWYMRKHSKRPLKAALQRGRGAVLIFALSTCTVALPGISRAQPAQSTAIAVLVEEANAHYALAQKAESSQRLGYLRKLNAATDAIVKNHPGSDEAMAILLDRQIDGISLDQVSEEIKALRRADLQTRLATVGTTYDDIGQGLRARPTDGSPSAKVGTQVASASPVVQLPTFNIPSKQSNAALLAPGDTAEALDPKTLMRRTQSALNALGCSVGTADGVAGRKTRSGYSNFLNAKNMSEEEYRLGSLKLLTVLEGLSGKVCAPPKAISLKPSNVAGQWSFKARCGPRSRLPNKTITGALAIAHRGGGAYSGKVRNSQGFNGSVVLRVKGRSVQGQINWGLLIGKTNFTGSVAKDELIVYGKDSNGCRMTVSKR